MKHELTINVASKGKNKEIIKSRHLKIREKLLNLLFGDFCDVLILKPSKEIKNIEIKEQGDE